MLERGHRDTSSGLEQVGSVVVGVKEDIESEVNVIFKSAWTIEETTKIPDPEDLKLGNHGKLIDGVLLYADLEDSTRLVSNYSREFSAEVFKAFLLSACRLIKLHGGSITSFDGDRVMAIFASGDKNSAAAKVGLQINHAIMNVVNPAMRAFYSSTDYKIKHVVGIDSGKILAARTGVRNDSDIVWVCPGANYAAKMCSIRGTSYRTFLSEDVYNHLLDPSKFGGTVRSNMWERYYWSDEARYIYGSNWSWSF